MGKIILRYILSFLLVTIGGSAWGQTTVLSENFDAGGLPTGWTRSVATNCSNFSFNSWMNTSEVSSSGSNWCTTPCTVGRGGAGRCMFFYDWFFTGVSSNYLQTPANDLSSFTSSSLTFYYYNSSGADVFNVYAKQGAGSYSLVGGPYATAGAAWTLVTIDMSAWAGAGFNQVYIKLEGNGVCGANNIGIDDVLLTGTATLPGENCTNAQDLTSLTSPYSATTVGYANDIATCRTGYADRIFYISVPNGSTVDIWQSVNAYDSYHYLGYGATCGSTTQIYCVDDPDTQSNSWTNSTGSTQTVWYIQDAWSGSGTFTLNWTLTGGTPAITLANNGTQVTAANVAQGTSTHVLHKISLAVTTANATLTGMQCVTAGTYASAHITNLKVRYSTDATLDAGDATLSTFTTPGTAGTKTFPSFTSQAINSGSTGYIFITADVAAGATGGNTININAITTSDLTFSSGTKSGSSTAGGTQTIVVPAITLADNGTQVTAANVAQGTTAHVLHKISLAVTTANATLTGMQCVTAGTYASADITNLKVRYSTDATLDAGDATLSTFTTPGTAGTKTFPSFTSQVINSGSTGYVFITADVAAGATSGNTINVNAVTTGHLTFSSGTKSGSSTAGGTQTFPVPAITLSDNGTQVTAANVQQGTTAHVLHKISLAVTTANATLTGMQCVTAGTYASADVTNLKVRYSTDATLDAGDATLSTFTTPGTAGTKTFPSFTSQAISSGSTGYIFITADIAAGATAGNTISVNAVGTGDLTFSSGTKSGSSSAGGIQTFIVSTTPTINLADNSTQIAAANVAQGTSGHVLHRISLDVTVANATLTGMECVTAGTYASADITNLKVRYSTDPTLDASDATLSTITSIGTAGLKTFTPFTSQVINNGTTGYIFITADIAAGATAGNTIMATAVSTGHLTFASGTKTGTSSAGGLQTIVSSTIIMSNSTINVCSANFYDSGNSGGNYVNNENYTLTITPPAGNCTRVTFSSYATETNYDFLRIYDGPSTSAPLIVSLTGSTTPTSSYTSITGGGSMTFNFTSDGGVVAPGWAATISCVAGCPVPSVNLADNGTQVSANTVGQGTTAHVLHKFSLAVGSQNLVQLTGINCTTTGTYAAADISNLKVRYSDDNTLNTGDATLSVLTNPGAAGSKTFPSFTNRIIPASVTGYFFITADIASGATLGNTIGLNAISIADLSYLSAVETGSTSSGGVQTITNNPPNDHCINAITLSVYSTCTNTSGTSVNGSATSPALSVCSGNEDDDVWYRFVATATTQTITVTPTGGNDVAFEIRNGSCNGNLHAGSCTNSGGNGVTEAHNASGLTTGSTYYVRVWNPAAGSGVGTFNICITAPFVEHVFEKTFGMQGTEVAYDAITTSDGGFLLAGYTNSAGAGSVDGYIVKADYTGNVLWSKTYGGSDSESFVRLLEVSSGGFALIGYSGNGSTPSSNAQMSTSYTDGWLTRIDASGNVSWSRVFSGNFRYQAMDRIFETTDGFILGGANSSHATGGGPCAASVSRGVDLWQVKTDFSGSMLWTKIHGICSGDENSGGANLLSTGEFIQTGRTNNTGGGLVLVKKNSSGVMAWSTRYATTTSYPQEVIQTTDGGYLITGYNTAGGLGGNDMFLLKTNATGNVSWSKVYGGSLDDVSYFVAQSTDGGYYFGGYSNSFGSNKYDYDGVLVKTDNVGTVLWSQKFGEGGSDILTNLRITSAGGLMMSGYTNGAGAGQHDMWLVMANRNGESECQTGITVQVSSLANPGESAFGNDYDHGTVVTPSPTVVSPSTSAGPKCEVFTPLPVDLLNFNVRCEKNTVLITWKTATEQNNDYFTIERSSDGQNYDKIGTVGGAGNSNSVRSYAYYDKDPLQASTSYYRLSQTDYNGQSETFLPLSVSCSDEDGFSMAVNPNLIHDGNVFVSIKGASDEKVLVVMTDILGRELYSVMLIENADSYLHSINFGSDIAPGLYFITASSKDEYISKKIVVK